MQEFHELLISAAREAGFPLAGAIDIDRADLSADIGAYDSWIGAGNAGAMEYLVRGRDRRANPRLLLPSAKSILCVAWPYDPKPAGASAASEGPRYARYLRSADYHKDIAAKLESMMSSLAARVSGPLEWKVCVDTSAVLERSWAVLAGLGWIGKNTLLIHPKLGSYLFLAEVLISRETGQGAKPLPNYCGNCARCLDSCPTGAFLGPRSLDSRRCTSYLTLEKRGPHQELDETFRRRMGTWIAGCDVCQEVCPFNAKPARNDLGFADQALTLRRWSELLAESEEAYKLRVKNSSLSRVKPGQFRRNLALALANAALEGHIGPASPEFAEFRAAVEAKMAAETDPGAQIEWCRCLAVLDGINTPRPAPG